MIKLLMIADDFTGALDTGVQFANQGANTRVITKPDAEWEQIDPRVEVLVIDAETRHLTAAQAYDIVYNLVKRGVALGIPYIYKKTDSALRGNIGAELSAVLEAGGVKQLSFLPAFPQMNRNTVGGVHYIAGVPVAESVFAKDPFEPVVKSDVTEIIALQSDVKAVSLRAIPDGGAAPEDEGILVFDAASEEDLVTTGKALFNAGKLNFMAGCAGFGTILNSILHISGGKPAPRPKLEDRLLMLCGSVNPITLTQLKVADEHNFKHLWMRADQKLVEDYFDTPDGEALLDEWREVLAENDAVIIDTNDFGFDGSTNAYAKEHGLTTEDIRVRISGTLGSIMGKLFDCPSVGTLFITGGDTLLMCMNRVGVYEMEPIGEMASGVVLSRFSLGGRTRFVISKSGGFGKPELLVDLVKQIKG